MKKQSCAGLWYFYDDKIKKLIEEQKEPYNMIKSVLLEILMEEEKISEKDYKGIDKLNKKIDDKKVEIINLMGTMDGKRMGYCGEIIFDKLFDKHSPNQNLKQPEETECVTCKINFSRN